MPNARKIIFSSYVIPTKSVEMEETSIRKKSFMASPGKTLGGKGSVDINSTQWGDGWISFSNSQSGWEDQSDVWELQGETWSGLLQLDTNAVDLTDDSSDLAFLYIKNTGSNSVLVSLNGSSGDFFLKIPDNGSINLRGDGTDLHCNDVHVKSSSGTTTIEYVIAKE